MSSTAALRAFAVLWMDFALTEVLLCGSAQTLLAVMTDTHSPVECAECGLPLDHIPEDSIACPPCSRCGATKRSYFLTASNAQPTNYLLDNYVAHKLSELNACGAPDLPEEGKWLNTFILKTIFHYNIPPKTRAYLFNFLRRTEGASTAYRTARRLLQEHLASPRNVVSPYFRSLTQFEICISQCYQGYDLLACAMGQKLYEPGHGTPEEKLQTVYVDSKHMDQMIHGDKMPEPATSGIWIINTGIESSRGVITFQEIHDLLRGMHGLAEKLCSIEPRAPAPTQ